MIHLFDNLYLDSDSNCIILNYWNGKTQLDKKGVERPVIQRQKYYNTLESLCIGLTKEVQRRAIAEAKTLEEVATLTKKHYEALRGILSHLSL